MSAYECEICGKPARLKRYTNVFGLIALSFRRESKVRIVCKEHQVKAGLNTLFMNIFFGWWGIHALVWNIIAIVQILNGGRDVTQELELAYFLEQQRQKNT